jgi:hypothetical protein
MDHHCPFVDNCIGYNNHKLFWNFLLYASLGCIHAVVITLNTGNNSFSNNYKQVEQNMTLSLMMAFSFSVGLATGLMFLSETYHFLTNVTTIEISSL